MVEVRGRLSGGPRESTLLWIFQIYDENIKRIQISGSGKAFVKFIKNRHKVPLSLCITCLRKMMKLKEFAQKFAG